MEKIDVFAHVLLPKFYKEMLLIDKDIPKKIPFINNDVLTDMEKRKKYKVDGVKQIISYVNVNPEDYTDPKTSYELCMRANDELTETIRKYPDMFFGGIAMIPMNNIFGAVSIIENQVLKNKELFGIQLFTRALNKSIADDNYLKIFEVCSKHDLIILLHPVFDERKPDNNIVFSWEYELSQAMMQIVNKGIFKKYPNLKIIVHHAGAMIPFFKGRIKYILGDDKEKDFKKFYVDTAILGNTKALELAKDYFGINNMLFGTDAPLGILPAGATKEITDAIEKMNISKEDKEKIFETNIKNLIKNKKENKDE